MRVYEYLFHEASKSGPGTVWGTITTSLIVSLLLIIMSISYPSLIFAGELEKFSGMGIQMALLSATILCIVLTVFSTCPGAVGVAQGETAAVLGLAAASLTDGFTESGNAHQLLPTVMATIVLSGLLVSLVFTLLGSFKLANLIRFIPLPVMGGFLAGVGWLLFSGAVKSLTGLPAFFTALPALLKPDMILRWLPGLISAVVLLLLQHYRRSVFNLIGIVIAIVTLFWLAVWLLGISPSALSRDGWLLVSTAGQGTWTPFDYAGMLTRVDWWAVFSQLSSLGTLSVIALIAVLMAASSLELLSRKDVDLNRELIAAGLGNFVCAAAGSLPGYHSLGASALARNLGTPVRAVGLLSALMCALTFSLGVSLLSFLPKVLVGTIVFFIALSLLTEWLYSTWFKLSRGDYSVLLLVFGCVSFVGLIKGVLIGLAAGVAMFAFEYSRISIARQVGSSVSIRSNVVYSEDKRTILNEHGGESYIVKLQGFLFFGTAHRLLNQVRSRMLDPAEGPLRCVVMDFNRVPGIDSTAAMSFIKLCRYAENTGFVLALTGLDPHINKSLEVAGIYKEFLHCLRKFEDLDHALEYCEKIIISEYMPRADEDDFPISEQLRQAFPDENQAAAFQKYLKPVTLPQGHHLIRQGDRSDDLFFIERGRVAVILEKPGTMAFRINSMGPGTVVGEIALFLGWQRSASVIAESEIKAHTLTRETLGRISKDDPDLVIAFQGFLVRMLAERLIDANRLISCLS
jgi:sulfate permease, SulP family